jgi:hypothetical protein
MAEGMICRGEVRALRTHADPAVADPEKTALELLHHAACFVDPMLRPLND